MTALPRVPTRGDPGTAGEALAVLAGDIGKLLFVHQEADEASDSLYSE